MFTGVTLLLRGGKLASQLRFGGIIFINLTLRLLWLRLILVAISLLLLLGELARQLILLHFVSIVFVLLVIVLLPSGFTGFLFSHPLRRQLNAIRGQFTAGGNAHAIRTRQLRANTLFHLRTRRAAGGQAE